MLHVKIPVKSFGEGEAIADDIFGSMVWENMPDGALQAYPYDSENPVRIEAIDNTPVIDLEEILWDSIKDELGKCKNIDPNMTMNDIVYSINCFIKKTYE